MDNVLNSSQDFDNLLKLPRTLHLEGSRLIPGMDSCTHVPYSALQGSYIVVEEKFDGAGAGFSFNAGGDLLLQSRGHYLASVGSDRQFNLFKHWAQAHEARFLERLEDRFVVHGEWMHKLHSIPYNVLPHYFLESDIWDRKVQAFLSTQARRDLLHGLPILPVPVLFAGLAPAKLQDITRLLAPSLAKNSNWTLDFRSVVQQTRLTEDQTLEMIDLSDYAEGLYIKVEKDGQTVGRFKWVRSDFVQSILSRGKHHAEQPYVSNTLIPGVDLFAPVLSHDWKNAITRKGLIG